MAIEHLYETFGSYRASAVAGCPCCVSAEEQARLHAKRLRQLSEEDLGSYAFSALNTWGTVTDLKHFLPRILELKAMGEMRTNLQAIYGKFVQEGVWPEVERRALERFTRALLVGAAPRAGACRMSDIIERSRARVSRAWTCAGCLMRGSRRVVGSSSQCARRSWPIS